MTTSSPSAFVLVGPTASGKSSVAQRLAEQGGVPLVSADSMNIYRGMDIGTAKAPVAERGSVDYYGIDLADPVESFSVGDWLRDVRPAFSDACPVVAGGTGLYVKCLLAGLDDLPAADEALRARAEKMTLAELQAEAQKAAPEAFLALSDPENPRRLVRLLEQSCRPGSLTRRRWREELPTVIGLHVERSVLHKRIAARVDEMYADGLIDEARGLVDLNLSSTAEKAIGYAEAFAVLRGDMSEAQARERTVIRTRRLAKRQMTWFRHQLNVEWVDTAKFQTLEDLASEISRVWKPVPVIA